jgi:hypothetical protein
MEGRHSRGLLRDVAAGDPVILSSGATAQFRQSYAKGYSGLVEILLDGAAETEDTESLILPQREIVVSLPSDREERPSQPSESGARAPSVRMED